MRGNDERTKEMGLRERKCREHTRRLGSLCCRPLSSRMGLSLPPRSQAWDVLPKEALENWADHLQTQVTFSAAYCVKYFVCITSLNLLNNLMEKNIFIDTH